MDILQRMIFPATPAEVPLFFRDQQACLQVADSLRFSAGGSCSFDTFYNACFLGQGGWPHPLTSLRCEVNLTGDFEVTLCTREAKNKSRVVARHTLRACEPEIPARFEIPAGWQGEQRVYPVLRAIGDGGVFHGGRYRCLPGTAKVRLAVVLCTYRREQQLLATLRTVAADEMLTDVRFLVVDNGQTLSGEAIPENCRIIGNRNLGGAGGFSRGLVECAEEGDISHVLFLDDDATCQPEAILRCRNYLQFRPESAVAGALLSERQPTLLAEAGAAVSSHSPLAVEVGHHHLDLAESVGLEQWQRTEDISYGGFWFFAFPFRVVQESGGLLPFFIKGDDVEFGLRLRKLRIPINLLAGCSVRHPDFSDFNYVKHYFWVRNMLIVAIINDWDRHDLTVALLREISRMWQRQTWRREMLLAFCEGVQDLLAGPLGLLRIDNDAKIKNLGELQAKGPLLVWLLRRSLRLVARLYVAHGNVHRQWLFGAQDLRSLEFWAAYVNEEYTPNHDHAVDQRNSPDVQAGEISADLS